MDPTHQTFDLSRQRDAGVRWNWFARHIFPGVGILAIVAGMVIYLVWSSSFVASFAQYAISGFLVAVGALAISTPWTILPAAAGSLEIVSEGVALTYGRGRRVVYRWDDPKLRIELWDCRGTSSSAHPGDPTRVGYSSMKLPVDIQLMWTRPGPRSYLSPEAFEAVIRAAGAKGIGVARNRDPVDGIPGIERVFIGPRP